MGAMETVCPHCGYDFPNAAGPRKEGVAYLRLADVALIVSTIAAGFGCLAAVGAGVVALVEGDWRGLVASPIAFFLQLGLLVVFIRIQDL